MNKHTLTFSMTLAQSIELIYGNLELVYPNGSRISYWATSGIPDYQRPGDEWVQGKGIIPAGEYEIPTTPYYLDTRGIEGLFFHITPDPVISDKGTRAELGLHFDANYPGSAGCIVLKNWDGWQGFCGRMKLIATSGIELLPLTVKYQNDDNL